MSQNTENTGDQPVDESKKPTEISPQDVERLNREEKIAASIPGVYSNRFFVFVTDVVKISFLETIVGSNSITNPQVSVVISRDDAKGLHNLLGALLHPDSQGDTGVAGR